MHRTLLVAIAVAISATACRGADDSPPPGAAPEQRTTASLIGEARKLDLAGRHEEAVALFRRVLEQEPDSFDAHYGLGRALDLAGHYDEAREHFARAIELSPEGARDQAQRMMGIAWTFAGNVDEAARQFREVFDRRVAADQFAGAADVANELGRVYLEHGRIDEAERWYRLGHETAGREAGRPRGQVVLADMRWDHARARIAARRGRAAEARRYEASVKRLLDESGDEDQQVHYPYLLGYNAFHLKDYEAAVGHLQAADQTDPFILLLLAEANAALEGGDRAREYYGKILESSSHGITSAIARPIARQKLAGER